MISVSSSEALHHPAMAGSRAKRARDHWACDIQKGGVGGASSEDWGWRTGPRGLEAIRKQRPESIAQILFIS